MVNSTSASFAGVSPRWYTRVSKTGSALSAAMSAGMDRMIDSDENMTTIAMKVMEKMTAFGRLRRGWCTSSAIEPALSKPTKDQPTNAMAMRNGPLSVR